MHIQLKDQFKNNYQSRDYLFMNQVDNTKMYIINIIISPLSFEL